MFCKKCGKELKDGVRFCTSCGQNVLMPVVQSRESKTRFTEYMSRAELAEYSKSIVNLILVITAGILFIVLAAAGYFLWSKRFDMLPDDSKVVEVLGDSVMDDIQVPSVSEDDGYSAPAKPEEKLREVEPVEEPEEKQQEVEKETSQYFLPTSSSEYLTVSDLAGFSQDDCRMARNELYARHGRRFADPNLQAYFDALDWYEGTVEPADFDESVMNEYELANRDMIVQYEKEMGYR